MVFTGKNKASSTTVAPPSPLRPLSYYNTIHLNLCLVAAVFIILLCLLNGLHYHTSLIAAEDLLSENKQLRIKNNEYSQQIEKLRQEKEKLASDQQKLIKQSEEAKRRIDAELLQQEKEQDRKPREAADSWKKNLSVFEGIPVNANVCSGKIERIGGTGDGSKVVCDVASLQSRNGNCVVHSYGANRQIQFDTELKDLTNCEHHSFDITPELLKTIGPRLEEVGVHFHLWGISDSDRLVEVDNQNVPLKTFQTIMKELGNDRLDILKMDVEGAEYQSLLLLAESPDCKDLPLTTQQILIELHVWQESNADGLIRLLEALQENCGFQAFAKEPNKAFKEQCWEVSFYRDVGTTGWKR